jgi:hypothetical protein
MKRLASVAVALLLAAAARGMFINSTVKVPVDRVVANVEKWIKEKPQDAQAQYVLGRIHAMAWAYGADLSLWRDPVPGQPPRKGGPPAEVAEGEDPFNGKLPGFAPYDTVQVQRREGAATPTADDAKHLAAAITHYRKAVELDGNNSLYELGFAWVLQQAGAAAAGLPADFPAAAGVPAAAPSEEEKARLEAAARGLGAADAGARDAAAKAVAGAMPKSYGVVRGLATTDAEVAARAQGLLKGYWDLQALEHYRKAYALQVEKDLAQPGFGPQGDSAIAMEAGEALAAILSAHPEAAKGEELKTVQGQLKTLSQKGRAMTPVVFAPPGGPQPARVAELVDPQARTTFDLAGDDVRREWPWLRPGTALLVWDPLATGRITSGRALFGSATWWVRFRDGYEALSVLDDDRDGQLAGEELAGIAVWTDTDGNGVSEPGEVVPARAAGVAAIAVRPRADGDGTLVVDRGIRFTDGETVPTFDWVTEPARAQSAGQ